MNRPKLICLVGIPGAGKTYYARNYVQLHGGVHLSSDGIRKELYEDESIQGDPHEVFSLMQSRAIEALNDGRTVIYDATNVTRKDRANIITACPKFVKIEAHVIWAPIETCIERDADRERTVGKAVIDKMLKRFQPPFYDEGFDDIKIIMPDDFDVANYAIKVMNDLNIPHDNPHHTADIKWHCIRAYLNACDLGVSWVLELAALWHDIGKPYTKSFVDSKGNTCEVAHYYSHQNVSSWMSYGMPNATPLTAWLVGAHMDPFFNSKYYNKLPPYLKSYVDYLHKCDLDAH
jgi:predicted kinase